MRRLVIVIAVTVSVAGCTERESVQAFVRNAQVTSQGIPPAPPSPVNEPATYDAFHLRDPFAVPRRPGVRREEDRQREPLEAYSLETLSMIGTLQRYRKVHALVRTPDNRVFQVGVGSRMGQHLGRVTAIRESAITLMEWVPGSEEKSREVVLNLVAGPTS